MGVAADRLGVVIEAGPWCDSRVVEPGHCLISPMVILDESNTPVAQGDEGACDKNDRITIVIEQDDLP